MLRCLNSHRLGLMLRLLIVVGCAMPFVAVRPGVTGLRFAQLPGLPSAPVPFSPIEEEEQQESTKELASATAGRHPDRPRSSTRGQPIQTTSYPNHCTAAALLRAAPTDPFHNGLGSPYRC